MMQNSQMLVKIQFTQGDNTLKNLKHTSTVKSFIRNKKCKHKAKILLNKEIPTVASNKFNLSVDLRIIENLKAGLHRPPAKRAMAFRWRADGGPVRH